MPAKATTTVRIDNEQYDALEKLRKDVGVPISVSIRRAIADYLLENAITDFLLKHAASGGETEVGKQGE